MKINRKQLRKIIQESLGPDAMERDEGGFDRNQQNKDIEQGLYDYFAAFLQAPEDKDTLNNPGFGFRMNGVVDSHGFKILDGKGKYEAGTSSLKNKNITHVYGYITDHVVDQMFATGRYGKFKEKKDWLRKAIDSVKRKTGNLDVDIQLGRTGNSLRYHGKRNDNAVYTINRID
jgi:hypothetical protein